MRIKTFGWRHNELDQISRIEQGFIELGHKIVEDDPDLIYCNNDFFDAPLLYAEKYPNAKKIFNILDLQVDNPNYNLAKVKDQLLKADAVTCISYTVQKQILDKLGIEANVIFNPIKDVYLHPSIEKQPLILYVGRANDPNKRFNFIREAFFFNENLIQVCGSENPFFGKYLGIVNDEDLNYLYNQSRFVLLPSKFEGLGLPMIEAMVCGSIPITCSDNPTALELCPPKFICDPNPKVLMSKICDLMVNYEENREIAIEYGNHYSELMRKKRVAKNILKCL